MTIARDLAATVRGLREVLEDLTCECRDDHLAALAALERQAADAERRAIRAEEVEAVSRGRLEHALAETEARAVRAEEALVAVRQERDEAKTFVAATIAAHPHVLEQEAELVAVRKALEHALECTGTPGPRALCDDCQEEARDALAAARADTLPPNNT